MVVLIDLPTRFSLSAIIKKADGSERETFTFNNVSSVTWDGDLGNFVNQLVGSRFQFKSIDADPDFFITSDTTEDPFRHPDAIQAWQDNGYVIESVVLPTDPVGEILRAIRTHAATLIYVPANKMWADRLPPETKVPNILVMSAGGGIETHTSLGKHPGITVQISVRTDNSLDADAIRELVIKATNAASLTLDLNSGRFVFLTEMTRGEIPEDGNVFHFWVRFDVYLVKDN